MLCEVYWVNSSSSVASRLQPHHRQEIAVKVLSKQEPISHIAHQEQVSRKFLYQQKEIAQKALHTAFNKEETEEQGLNPDYTLADAGKGIRAGQKAAWGDKPCHGDIWHILDQCEALCRNLTKKAQGAKTKREELELKMELAKLKGKGNQLSAKLTQSRQNEAELLKLASDCPILLYLFWYLRINDYSEQSY